MRKFIRHLLICVLLLAGRASAQVYLTAVNQDNTVVRLSWTTSLPTPSFTLYRTFASTGSGAVFHAVATTSELFYDDTIRRTLCHDTILYYVAAAGLSSDSVKVPFTDAHPTAPPTLDVCSVDSLSQRIRLSWHPSADTDILGYFICTSANPGTDPFLPLDTLWSATDTSYLVPASHSVLQVHSYRIYAFDSCRTASPLTDPYHNIVLDVSAADCQTLITASWNDYVGMLEGVHHYEVLLLNPDAGWTTLASVAPTSLLEVSHLLPSTALSATLCVKAFNADGSCVAQSNRVCYSFSTADTARYLFADMASVTADNQSVRLQFSVDSTYTAGDYRLYRSQNGGAYAPITSFSNTGRSQIVYTDNDVVPGEIRYFYRLGVLDGCQRNEKFSPVISPVFLTLNVDDDEALVSAPQTIALSWTAYSSRLLEDPRYHVVCRQGDGEWRDLWSTSSTDWEDVRNQPAQSLSYRIACFQLGTADTAWSNLVSYKAPTRLWVPNAFTPAERTNQLFCVNISGIGAYSLHIYDRNGLLVFHTTDPGQCWDGSAGGTPCPAQSYIYIIQYEDNIGISQHQVGTVILIR